MSIVTATRSKVQAADKEPVECWMTNGLPALEGAEAIPPRPLRLSPAELEVLADLNRVGYLGDEPADPVRRPGNPDARRARDEIERICATEPNPQYRAWQECGAWFIQYGSLYRELLSARAEIERMRRDYYPWGADEAPELPDAAYYDPADEADLAGATADQADGYNS